MYSHLHKVLIPYGLKPMLEGFSRTVVKCKPKSIPHFAEEYFKALLSFRDENPNLSFDELLKKFQQSQFALSNLKGTPPQTIHHVESKEWEAGPLFCEARINQTGPLLRFPANDSSESVSKDAQDFITAQFLTSEGVEAEIEQSDLDGIISANVVTLSPGPIKPELAVDMAVFRRKTTPKSSAQNSCRSSPAGNGNHQGSPLRPILSALFERVSLNDISVDVDAVLIQTSILPNVSQIVVQSEEVPEIIVFQADKKLTNSVSEPAFAGMEPVTLNEENTSLVPALLNHCGPDTGDAMMAKTSESVELIASKCLVESSGDQVIVETKIDSASQSSRGSASQQSSQLNIAACVVSQEDQIPVEMKESASHKSSSSSLNVHPTSNEDQITTVCENNLDSASNKSSLSNVISATFSLCDGQSANTELPDVTESVITKDIADILEVQTETEAKEEEENEAPVVTVQETSVVLDTHVSTSDLTATTSAEHLAAEDAMATTDGNPGSQTTLYTQGDLISNLAAPNVQEEITEKPSPCQACELAIVEGKTSNSHLAIPSSEQVSTDVLVSAGTETGLSGEEAIQITDLINPLPADCEVQEDKTSASTQANGSTSLEVRAPYLVYLPLPSVEVLTPGMVPQAAADGEENKASPYVYIPVATGDLPNSPSFVAATTPQLSRTCSFAGPFVPFTETQKTQNSAQTSRPASQGHLGFSKIRRPHSHCPAVVSSASSHQHAGAAATNNGQQPNISSCSCGKLPTRPSEPTVASVCSCVGSTSHWRLCHLTHPGAQGRHQLPCHYQSSPSMSHCGLEQIARIPMYQDCGLYCSCRRHMLHTRPSCSSSRIHRMAEPSCSGHALGPLTRRHGCLSEHVCGHRVLPATPTITDHHYSCCWRASCAPVQPCHSSLMMCDLQDMTGHSSACGGVFGQTKATTVPSCSHQSTGPEACHDYRTNYNL